MLQSNMQTKATVAYSAFANDVQVDASGDNAADYAFNGRSRLASGS